MSVRSWVSWVVWRGYHHRFEHVMERRALEAQFRKAQGFTRHSASGLVMRLDLVHESLTKIQSPSLRSADGVHELLLHSVSLTFMAQCRQC